MYAAVYWDIVPNERIVYTYENARAAGRFVIAKLIYSAIASLDGYIEDQEGNFRWAEPDEEVHAFLNEVERSVGTLLLGRRMYEVLVFWETIELDDQPPAIQDFAEIWRAADKIVYSRTLPSASSARTKRFLPGDVRMELELLDERRFGSGVVYLRYGTSM